MKSSFFCVAILIVCMLAACKADNNKPAISDITLANINMEKSEDGLRTLIDTNVFIGTTDHELIPQSGSPATADWDKKIIKTAVVTLEVTDFPAFKLTLLNIISNSGAYTAGEQQREMDGRIENNITVKVPVDRFDPFLNNLQGEGIKLISKDITTEDISTKLIDTKARMEARKQLRDKYAELLNRASNMKDILQVNSEINNIQEELEAAAARVNYLSHAAAYSTVTIHCYQYLDGSIADKDHPSFTSNLKQAFIDGSKVLEHVLLFLISVWPLMLGGLLLFIYFKKGKPRKIIQDL